MPTDTRRITGPDGSHNPLIYCKRDPSNTQTLGKRTYDKKQQKVNDKGCRKDGRQVDQVRPLFLKSGVISQARGSAYIEQNETKVMCAVYGPREVEKKEDFSMKGQITCDFKFATFSCLRRRQHQQDSEEKDFSVQLQNALEPAVCLHTFPKAQINVFVNVLQNDGSALAAAITAASVAIATAGIEMYDLVAVCSARMTPSHILLDPTENEDYKSSENQEEDSGSVTVALMPSLNQVSAVISKGEVQFEVMKKGINQCVQTCQKLYPVLQQCIVKSVQDKMESVVK